MILVIFIKNLHFYVFSILCLLYMKFPNAENLSSKVLSLPIHAYLDYDQIEYIVSTLLDYDKSKIKS